MYSFTSNIISLLISVLTVFLLPKFITVEEYGVWQLFLFYISYLSYLHFGWIDGIYLRHAGENYLELKDKGFLGQFLLLFIFETLIATIIGIILFYYKEFEFSNILIIACFYSVFFMLTGLIRNIFRATGEIKKDSQLLIMERLFFLIILIVFLFLDTDIYYLILLNFTEMILACAYSIYLAKDIVINGSIRKRIVEYKDAVKNITVGSKLMIANISGILVLGIIRMGIVRAWDIETFGKISLTLNIANLFLVFINAASIVIFPIIKRANQESLPLIYIVTRTFLMVILLGGLAFYYPIKVLLSLWLPQYEDSLIYMAILFPVCLYESKVSMLVNTYLKSLRKEKIMLQINLLTLAFSICLTWFATCYFNNLGMAVFSIILVFSFRSILSEFVLSVMLKINIKIDIILELIMSLSFIFINWSLNNWNGFFIYVLLYMIYFFLKRKSIWSAISVARIYIRRENQGESLL